MTKITTDIKSAETMAKDKLTNTNSMPGIRLDFADLGFTVVDRATGQPKSILDGVSGSCSPGRLFALMGGSGAGKTTLLDLLACNTSIKSQGSSIQGSVRVNGAPRDAREFAKISCYVQQKDLLYASATVSLSGRAGTMRHAASPHALGDHAAHSCSPSRACMCSEFTDPHSKSSF